MSYYCDWERGAVGCGEIKSLNVIQLTFVAALHTALCDGSNSIIRVCAIFQISLFSSPCALNWGMWRWGYNCFLDRLFESSIKGSYIFSA